MSCELSADVGCFNPKQTKEFFECCRENDIRIRC